MGHIEQLKTRFLAGSANVQGMAWMALATMIFACFMGLVKFVGKEIDPIQTSFLRYAFGLLFLLPFFLKLNVAAVRSANWKMHGLRGTLHGIGVMLWFYAMTQIPLAEVTAISFTNSVFATIGAVLFLRERIRLPRITAVAMGLIGALIILRPGIAIIHPGAIAMVVAAIVFAGSDLCAKVLTRNETGPAVVAYLSIVVTLVTAVPALSVWQPMTLEQWGLMVVIAGLATLGHLAMTQGFKMAEVSAIQPARFLMLIWTALTGYVFFAEVPDIYTWTGAVLIMGATLYIARREAALRKRGEQTVQPTQSTSTNTG